MTVWQSSISDNGALILEGEIDYSVAAQVRTALHRHIESSGGAVVLDMEKVSYIDSTGLALLIELRRKLQEQSREIRISAASVRVRQLFELTQIAPIFGLRKDRAD
ncbi:anti-anti-sigma factor [Oleidesulfovibrio alaskensis G20]|jgi:anti-sigma B factor antagonist|uniref:Anti-sigma factor antagonist n=1 Tax=Oleidesulfovibrio alaskensis (strain ATCC BAA-1058 / DSM 17464 / G20) TaxID=207559 RepID=Q317Q1_OLEA2|nr:STAS domain-containing protein [Oleidesulfovibrio alaskensis]ABB36825.1 anti-anti-sigma factor [Oleidesulfovibrio alaskensis G20]